jgi:hypothetical protein
VKTATKACPAAKVEPKQPGARAARSARARVRTVRSVRAAPAATATDDNHAGGGGGGGAGFGPSGVTFETGVREGDGVVTITYDPAAGGCPVPVTPASPTAVVAEPRFTG